MGERAKRHWAASEGIVLALGGVSIVAEATGLARSTVGIGKNEVRSGVEPADLVVERRAGGGCKRVEDKYPEIVDKVEAHVAPGTRGDPESRTRWTSKSTQRIADAVSCMGPVKVDRHIVRRILKARGYSLQAPRKTAEGKHHPDRNRQFEYIDAKVKDYIESGIPVVSVDTKKKEIVGNFRNGGRE